LLFYSQEDGIKKVEKVSDVAKIMSTEHYVDIMMQVREKLEQLNDESTGQGASMQPSYECVCGMLLLL
jgi:hypothetical protein